MFDLIERGGALIWFLMGCSFLALGVFVERIFTYHRSSSDVTDLLQGLANLIRKKNFAEALHMSTASSGPVARVVHSAILRHTAPREELKAIVQETGQLEMPKLERYLPALLTIAYVAPLIGLLGTVVGMVDTFQAVTASSGFATPTDISKGVYECLVTSAAGLAVAIVTYVLYAYLAAMSRTLMHDMERGGIEIVNIICDSREAGEEDIIAFSPSEKSEQETVGDPLEKTSRKQEKSSSGTGER